VKATSNATPRARPRYRWVASCVGTGLGVTLILLILAVVTWLINNRTPRITIPKATTLEINGFDDFLSAARIAKQNESFEPSNLVLYQSVPASEAQLVAHDRAMEPAIALIKRGLTKQCIYPRVSPGDTSRDDERSNFRRLSCSMVAIGRHHALKRRPGEALDFWLDGIDVAVRTSYGADSSMRHSNDSCVTMILSCLDAYRFDFTQIQLRRIHSRLTAAEAFREPLAVVLRRDGWNYAETNIAALRDPDSYGSWAGTTRAAQARRLLLSTKSFDDFATLSTGLQREVTWGDRRDAVAFVLGSKQRMVEENLAYNEKFAAAVARDPYHKPALDAPHNMMAWSQDISLSLLHTGESSWAIARAQIALLLFRTDQGRYPDRLAELTPRYLKSVPRDPYAGGNELMYRSTPKSRGFKLYSVGIDGRNDQGQRRSKGASGYDIVAGSSDALRQGYSPFRY
jgi:hypothetical protein